MTTKKMAIISILSAMAIIVNLLIHFPIVPAVGFLCYDPKDVVILIAGFIYGPLTSFGMSLICSIIELLYRGGTYIDVLMNVISTCSFVCVATIIYKHKKTKNGAIMGLIAGVVCSVLCMLLWNYLVTPIYYKMPREAVVELLLPGILPFNLIKSGLNACIAMLLYKPVVTILRSTSLLEQTDKKHKISIGFIIVGVFIILTIVALLLVINGIL